MTIGRFTTAILDLYPDHLGSRTLVTNSFFPLTTSGYPQGNRFSDFGLGWRFLPNLSMQYVYSTDYGFSSGSHALMLRYTLRLRGE